MHHFLTTLRIAPILKIEISLKQFHQKKKIYYENYTIIPEYEKKRGFMKF